MEEEEVKEEVNGVQGAILCILVVVRLVCAFVAGITQGKSQVVHECQTFQATAIEGKKFRCELVKE